MKLQKIKESELAELGIGSLSTRPALPSLYSGRSLSAQELKDAFDRLPRLIASRFNTLLSSLGLYGEDKVIDRLSEVLATGIKAGHSFDDLIDDIKNGVFCTYLTVDGVHTLRETLAALSARIDKTFDFNVKEVGEGNVVTSIEEIDDTVFVHKNMSTEDFALKSEAELIRSSLLSLKNSTVEDYEIKNLDARVKNVEEALKGNAFAYEKKEGTGVGSLVPRNALPYAMMNMLGGRYAEAFTDNLLPSEPLEVSHTPSDDVGYRGSVWAEGSSIVFDGQGLYEADNLRIVLCNGAYESGLYHLEPLGSDGLAYHIIMKNGSTTVKTLTVRDTDENRTFYMPINADGLRISIIAVGYIYPVTVTPMLRKKSFVPTEVRAIRSVGKNLLPPEVYDLKNWERVGQEKIAFPITLPEYGDYTVSLSLSSTEISQYLHLERSTDGGKSWTSAVENNKHLYLVGVKTNHTPVTFEHKKGYLWRLWYYPSNALNAFVEIRNIQIEKGGTATEYEPYKETIYPIPDAVLNIPFVGGGISDTVYNYVDFERKLYCRRVILGAYTEGDENKEDVMTDGNFTTVVLDTPDVFDISDVLDTITFPLAETGGALYFETQNGASVPYAVTYQIKLTEGETV